MELSQLGDKSMFRIGDFSTDSEDELIDFLMDFVNKADGAFVQAQPGVPFEYTARAIAACRLSGFSQVTMIPGAE